MERTGRFVQLPINRWLNQPPRLRDAAVASRNLLDRAATPPCPRRGIPLDADFVRKAVLQLMDVELNEIAGDAGVRRRLVMDHRSQAVDVMAAVEVVGRVPDAVGKPEPDFVVIDAKRMRLAIDDDVHQAAIVAACERRHSPAERAGS